MRMWVVLLFLALVSRFWGLGEYPKSFDMDEAAVGYYAYTLLYDGRDEYGNLFPVNYPSNGDYKLAGYSWVAVPAVAMWGLNEKAVRMPAAIFGVVGVIIAAWLGTKISRNKQVGWWVGLVYALSPWTVMLARGAYEVQVATTFLMVFVACVLQIFDKKWKESLVITGLGFGALVAMFTYPGVRLLMLGLLLIVVLISARRRRIGVGVVAIFLFGVGMWGTMLPGAGVRSEQTLVWAASRDDLKKDVDLRIYEDGRSELKQPLIMTRALHNQLVAVGMDVSKRFLSYLSLEYLFWSGDVRPQFQIKNVGLFLVVWFPFLVIGMLGGSRVKKLWWLGLGWMLVATIPAAMTASQAHIIRHFPAAVGVTMMIGVGLAVFWKWSKGFKLGVWLRGFLVGLTVVNLYVFADAYLIHKEWYRPWYGEVSTKEMVLKTLEIKDRYSAVAISKNQYIFWGFYGQINPKEFRSQIVLDDKVDKFGWERVGRWENVNFKMPENCPKAGKTGVLYVCRGATVPQNADVVDVFRFTDGVPEYVLIEFWPINSKKMAELPEGLDRRKDVGDGKATNGILADDYPTMWP